MKITIDFYGSLGHLCDESIPSTVNVLSHERNFIKTLSSVTCISVKSYVSVVTELNSCLIGSVHGRDSFILQRV